MLLADSNRVRLDGRYATTVVLIAGGYFIAAKVGLSLAFTTKQVTALWPPTGIAMAALLLCGLRVWPAIFIGAFLINATVGDSRLVAAAMSVGNTLGPVVATICLRRVGFDSSLARVRDVLALTGFGAFLGMAITATNGTACLAAGAVIPWSAYTDVWWVWWVGDAMGVLVFAPLILSWASPRPVAVGPRHIAEPIVLTLGLVGACLLALTGALSRSTTPFQLQYAVFPFVVWVALRFGARETTLVAVLITGLALWGATHDRGPFATGNLDERLILLEMFMAVVVVSGLILCAVAAERSRALGALKAAHDDLERRIHERTAELAQANEVLAQTNLEQLKTEDSLKASEANARAILDAIPDLVFRLSKDGRYLDYRAPMSDDLYIPGEQLIGNNIHRVLPMHVATEVQRHIDSATASGAMEQWEFQLDLAKGLQDFEARMVAAGEGEVMLIVRNITAAKAAERQIRASLREKEVLLQEIQHRVKNNLQVISSLINMQARGMTDEGSRLALSQCQTRIQAIALIHETLYQSADYGRVPFSEYAKSLAHNVFLAAGPLNSDLALDLDGIDSLSLPVDQAIPCGLILNELMTNALKHAFPSGRDGSLRVHLRAKAGGMVCLGVQDDGVGAAVVGADMNTEAGGGLGMQLIATLTKQLGGRVEIDRSSGTDARIFFPAATFPALIG